ncbi:toxin-antitoxin system antidote component (plasmid) [Cyanobacterium sp. HL-69]|uniref:nucleotidyltransferase family protein n=1 Tax=unclassified Cyanobacterium TaxID=2629879 RepID=UPI000CA37C25|nr:nucleotidyltransferase domain-containing protein [Cyanobacterium sp. IPPAS B-1200]AUC62555.1 toxin-antitoxin system antidote component [Cyanobacterium sp. HL-69]
MMLLLSHSEIEQRLKISLNQLFDICQQYNIKEMALFGSILRDDFNNKSDIDFLISFQPNTPQGLLTISKLKSHLESLLNYPVDITIKDSLKDGDNWIRRNEILNTAQTIYE